VARAVARGAHEALEAHHTRERLRRHANVLQKPAREVLARDADLRGDAPDRQASAGAGDPGDRRIDARIVLAEAPLR